MQRDTSSIDLAGLDKIRLFRHVSPECIERILEAAVLREIGANEALIMPEQTNTEIYLLLSGRLRVHLGSLDSPPLDILEPGESVGEMSVIDGGLTSAYVVADEPCKLLILNEEMLWSIARASHAAAFNLLTTLTRRLRRTNSVICNGLELERDYHCFGSIDALTGLHNRYWLNNALRRQMVRCRIDRKAFSLILMDVDNFKQFNDSYGHLWGDKALFAAAHALTENLRINEMAARYGGDEFLVLLPDLDCAKAATVAERLRGAVNRVRMEPADDGPALSLTVSLGVAEAGPNDTPESVIALADSALYRAKAMGRNRIECHSGGEWSGESILE